MGRGVLRRVERRKDSRLVAVRWTMAEGLERECGWAGREGSEAREK